MLHKYWRVLLASSECHFATVDHNFRLFTVFLIGLLRACFATKNSYLVDNVPPLSEGQLYTYVHV